MNFLRNINVVRNINEFAKPTETLLIGVLVGILLGMSAFLFIPVDIKQYHHNSGEKLCDSFDNVELMRISIMSRIKTVKCIDGRIYKDF